MEKINFQNGVTKVNADTFNTFQNNINDAISLMKIEILKAENPIGHIRMETTDVNPATYLGFGTWVLWGAGKVPVGVDTADTDFSTVEKTGGEKTHKHISPLTYLTIGNSDYFGTTNKYSFSKVYDRDFFGNSVSKKEFSTESEKLAYHTSTESNVQPYITCYMWKRVS